MSSSSFKDASLYQSPGSKCKPCPVVHPIPVCGSDGHTYSSQVPPPSPSYPQLYGKLCTNYFFPLSLQCKLEYQSCITGKKIVVKCPGMCPCPAQAEPSTAEKKGTRLRMLPASLCHPTGLKRLQIGAEISFSHVCCALLPRRWLHFLIQTLNPEFTEGNNSARGLYLLPRQCCDLSRNININTMVSASEFIFGLCVLSALTSNPGWICWIRAFDKNTR